MPKSTTTKPATNLEKEQMRELLRQGHTVEEVTSRFPHVDGRVVSGVYRRMQQVGPPGTAPAAVPPPAPSPTETASPAPGPVSNSSVPGVRAAAVVEHNRTGFTPESRVHNNAEGFRPDWQEYYVIKKLTPPDEGIRGTEYPPFDLKTLAERYPAGEYQVQHYRDGRLYQTYRERIATKNPTQNPQNGPIMPEPARPVSAVDEALRLANAIHSVKDEERREAAAAKQLEATAKLEEVRGKTQVETSAQVALMQMVNNLLAGKDSKDPVVAELIGVLKSDKDTVKRTAESELEMMRQRSKIEMEELRERAKLDREAERERAKNEMERFKLDLQERDKINREFMSKMQEIETERQRLNQEWREQAMQRFDDMQRSVDSELSERRKMNEELIKIQRQAAEEAIKMRKEMGAGANDLKVAEIIERGITTSLDRIGARVDLLVSSGAIGNGKANPVVQPKLENKGDAKSEATQTSTEEPMATVTEDSIRAEFSRPWFRDWKDQVLAVLRKRAKGVPIDGSLMGQAFVDSLNKGEVKPAHLQWVISRTWKAKNPNDPNEPKGLLDFAAHALTDAELAELATEDGEAWFSEFVWFVANVWNDSIKRAREARGQ